MGCEEMSRSRETCWGVALTAWQTFPCQSPPVIPRVVAVLPFKQNTMKNEQPLSLQVSISFVVYLAPKMGKCRHHCFCHFWRGKRPHRPSALQHRRSIEKKPR